MILVSLTLDGQASVRNPQRIGQGSDSEAIIVLSPFPVRCPVMLGWVMPDGTALERVIDPSENPQRKTKYFPMQNVVLPTDFGDNEVSVWMYKPSQAFTEQFGTALACFYVQLQDDTQAYGTPTGSAYSYRSLTYNPVEIEITETIAPDLSLQADDGTLLDDIYEAITYYNTYLSDIAENGASTVLKPGETENIAENRKRVYVVDTAPTAGNNDHLVTSGGVKTALNDEATRADLYADGVAASALSEAKGYTDQRENVILNNVVTGVKGGAEADYRKGNVNITKDNIGLGNVDNTSDMSKPVSAAQSFSIAVAREYAIASAKQYTDQVAATKQNTLTFDNDPTAGSNNPVYSKGIKTAIDSVRNAIPTKTSDLTNNGNGTSPYATESFVNSSIATNTAYFRGTYNIVTDLGLTTSATEQQIITAIAAKMTSEGITPTNDDYCYVAYPDASDATQFSKYDRYKYDAANSTWEYEYTLNNSSFTAAQWAAINSGITGTLVSQITTNKNDISGIKDGAEIDSFADVENALAGKQDALTFDSTPTAGSTNPVTSEGIKEYVDNNSGNGKSAVYENETFSARVNIPKVYNSLTDVLPNITADSTIADVINGMEANSILTAHVSAISSSHDRLISIYKDIVPSTSTGEGTLVIVKKGGQSYCSFLDSGLPNFCNDEVGQPIETPIFAVEQTIRYDCIATPDKVLKTDTNTGISYEVEISAGMGITWTNAVRWIYKESIIYPENGIAFIGQKDNSVYVMRYKEGETVFFEEFSGIQLPEERLFTISNNYLVGYSQSGAFFSIKYDGTDKYISQSTLADVSSIGQIRDDVITGTTSSYSAFCVTAIADNKIYIYRYDGSESLAERQISVYNTGAIPASGLVAFDGGAILAKDANDDNYLYILYSADATYAYLEQSNWIDTKNTVNDIYYHRSGIYPATFMIVQAPDKEGGYRDFVYGSYYYGGRNSFEVWQGRNYPETIPEIKKLFPAYNTLPFSGGNIPKVFYFSTAKRNQIGKKVNYSFYVREVHTNDGDTSSSEWRAIDDKGSVRNQFDALIVEIRRVTSVLQSAIDAKLSATGNGSNLTATYSEAADRTNLVSGEKLSVSLGKIKKYFTDLNGVAFSGSYADLSNKPTIPTVNNATLTIKKNGTSVQTFTANAFTDVTADITVPTKTSDLNNDSGFITSSALPTVNNATLTIQKNGTTVQTFTANALTDVTADISVPTQTSQLTNNGSDGDSPYASESFVNSSISTNTANFIGTFASVSALNSYSGTVTNNDYAFVTNGVITDNGNDFATFAALNAYSKSLVTNFDYAWVINGAKFDLYRFDIVNQQWDLRVQNTDKASVTLNSAYNRYKASVSSNVVTWSYEYTLNNSSFTAAQWTAINSGITSAAVSQISTNTTNIGNITNGTNINSFSGVENALANKQATITGGASTIVTNNLTANRALLSDASGKVGVSSATATELGYLSGVTSAIQTQLSNKLSTNGGTISGNLSVMGNLSGNKGPVAYNQIFGIREGSYINNGDTLYINTDIPISMIVSMLSGLDLTESVDVEGTPVDVSAILFEDENNNTEGIYMADLSVLGGSGYIIFLAKVIGSGSYRYEQVLFVSDVSDPTNEVLIQEFFPTFTMPSDAGWLVESVMITTNVGPIRVLRDQQSTTVTEYAKYISGMFTLDTSLRDMIKFMIDYSVTSVLNTPV